MNTSAIGSKAATTSSGVNKIQSKKFDLKDTFGSYTSSFWIGQTF